MDHGEEVSPLSLHWVENLIFLPRQLQLEQLSGETSVCEYVASTDGETSMATEEEARNGRTSAGDNGPLAVVMATLACHWVNRCLLLT